MLFAWNAPYLPIGIVLTLSSALQRGRDGETAHSSYFTYVFGRTWTTMIESEGRRSATYASG